jgi:hypothetical protein
MLKFFLKPKCKILIIFLVSIVIITSQFFNKNIISNQTSFKVIDNNTSQCENEWVKLNNNKIFFEKNYLFVIQI